MKRIAVGLSVLLILTSVLYAQGRGNYLSAKAIQVLSALFDSSSNFTFASVVPRGGLELRDPTKLGSESLANGALTSGTSWTATGDFALASNAATYTHSTGSGSFQQTSAASTIPWASTGINGWFSLTYTVSAVTGTPTCTVPNTFALTAVPLPSVSGTATQVFQAVSTTPVSDFKVSCTSAATATITFDDLSLKQINGGSLTVQGQVLTTAGFGSVSRNQPGVVLCGPRALSTVSATAQTIATITTTTTTAGSVQIFFSTTANNGTLQDQDGGAVLVSWNNNAGTVAATMTAIFGQSDQDASGTLATTPTATVATNVVSIKFTPTWVTIVPTTVTGYATFLVNGVNSVTCQ